MVSKEKGNDSSVNASPLTVRPETLQDLTEVSGSGRLAEGRRGETATGRMETATGGGMVATGGGMGETATGGGMKATATGL